MADASRAATEQDEAAAQAISAPGYNFAQEPNIVNEVNVKQVESPLHGNFYRSARWYMSSSYSQDRL